MLVWRCARAPSLPRGGAASGSAALILTARSPVAHGGLATLGSHLINDQVGALSLAVARGSRLRTFPSLAQYSTTFSHIVRYTDV